MVASRVLGSAVGAAMLISMGAGSVKAQPVAPDRVKQGEYLARAGDCFGCHTGPGRAMLAGGRQVQTPYGSISSPNITPDRDTGIGAYTDDDFYRVMHDGIDRNGGHLYPVMPFDHYTKVSRADDLAIKAYLFSLKPEHAPRVPSHLEFPFNIRTSLVAWRAMFFKAGAFAADPRLSEQENRGAYLVEGLGHCGACHTPRNMLSGTRRGDALGGGVITGQGWFAPNISSDWHEGIGAWSDTQLVTYLKDGRAPNGAMVAGPMAEVVRGSLHYLSDDDLHAIAAYLKASPAKALYAQEQPQSPAGVQSYLDHCAFCHQLDGKGVSGAVPALAGSGIVRAGGPEDVIRTILGGVPAQGSLAPMPGLATQLTTTEVADIANYIRSSWGNTAPPNATPGMVGDIAKTSATMLAGTGDCSPVPPQMGDLLNRQQITPLLRTINAGNMLEQIDGIIAKLSEQTRHLSQAELVNGLTAAYCPMARQDVLLSAQQRLERVQRFASLAYSELSQHQAAPAN